MRASELPRSDSLFLAGNKFLRQLRNLQEWWRQDLLLHSSCPYRETIHLINNLLNCGHK